MTFTEQAKIGLGIAVFVFAVLIIYLFASQSRDRSPYVATLDFVCHPCAEAPRDHTAEVCKGGTYCDCQHKGQREAPKE